MNWKNKKKEKVLPQEQNSERMTWRDVFQEVAIVWAAAILFNIIMLIYHYFTDESPPVSITFSWIWEIISSNIEIATAISLGKILGFAAFGREKEETEEEKNTRTTKERELEENTMEIAYTDVWELTKDANPSSRLRARLVFLVFFMLRLLFKSVLTFVLHTGVSYFLGYFNLAASILFALLFNWMSLVTYGTEVISKKSYIRLFGNKKYELPEPINKAWELVFVILASILSLIASFPLL